MLLGLAATSLLRLRLGLLKLGASQLRLLLGVCPHALQHPCVLLGLVTARFFGLCEPLLQDVYSRQVLGGLPLRLDLQLVKAVLELGCRRSALRPLGSATFSLLLGPGGSSLRESLHI